MRRLFLNVLLIFSILIMSSSSIIQGQADNNQDANETLFIRVANIKFQAGTPDSSSYTYSYIMEIWNFKNYTIRVDNFSSVVGNNVYTHNVPQIASDMYGNIGYTPIMNVYDTINFSSGITSYTINGTFKYLDINTVPNGVYEFHLYSTQSPINFVFCRGYYLYGSKTSDGPVYDPIPQEWGNITNKLPTFQVQPLDMNTLQSQITPTDTNDIYLPKTTTITSSLGPSLTGSTISSGLNIIIYGFVAVLLGVVIIAVFINKSQSTRKNNQESHIFKEKNLVKKNISDNSIVINRVCPKCGQKIYPTDSFCSNCGDQMEK